MYKIIYDKTDSTLTSRTGWSAGASISFSLSRLIASIIIARTLGPEGVGKIAYLLWIADFTLMMTSMGLNSSAIRFVAELRGEGNYNKAEQIISWIYLRHIALMFMGTVILFFSGFFLKLNQNDIILWLLLSLLYLMQGIGNIYQANLAGNQRFDLIALLNFVYSVLLIITVLIGARIWGLHGVIAGYLISSCLPAILSFTMFKRKALSIKIEKLLVGRIWKYSINTWVAGIVSSIVWSRMEIFFINYYWNSHEVALFTVGLSISAIAAQGTVLLSGALVPHYAERFGANDMEGIRKVYSSGTKLIGAVFFPLCFGGAALVPLLIPLLYGNQFISAIPVSMILMVLSLIYFCSPGSALVYGLGRSFYIAASGIIGAILVIIGNLILVPKMGCMGAAIVRSSVQLIMVGLGIWYIMKKLQCPFPFKSIGKSLLLSILCAIIIYIPVRWNISIILLILCMLISVVSYIMLIRLFKVLSQKDLKPLEEIIQYLPDKIKERAFIFINWFNKELLPE